MAAPYSTDLRLKVLQAIDAGMGKAHASRSFNISRNTIGLWLKRRAETGSVAAKEGYHTGHRAKITDWQAFREFVVANPGKLQREIAEAWGVSQRTISRALVKLNLLHQTDED